MFTWLDAASHLGKTNIMPSQLYFVYDRYLINPASTRVAIALLLLVLGFLLAVPAVAQPDAGQVRGVIKAADEAVITADVRAPVKTTNVRTGEAFAQGDTLLEFDCTGERAELEAARAAYQGAKARYDNQKEMLALDAAGAFDVALAKAERDEASARARVIAARIKGCKIIAPFAGRVAQLSINAHELPANDQPLMKIVSTGALELRLIVPSRWLSWVAPGTAFDFIIDETGARHEATVLRLGAEVDAVSGTVPIIATFETLPPTVLPGMSGVAEFAVPQG
ncbi:MAG: efflux RND transporter periplasmic adaptor subunit [Pseudomonadota bacterium]